MFAGQPSWGERRRSVVLFVNWGSIGHAALNGLESLLSNPLFYLILVVMLWDRTRNSKFERRFFGVRVSKVWLPWLRRFAAGLLIGAFASIVLMVAGVVVQPITVWVLTGITIILALIRLRFSATGYGLAILLAVSLAGRMLPLHSYGTFSGQVGAFLSAVDVDSWMGIAAVLFLVEALWLRLHKQSSFAPAVVTSKRGRSMGAAVLQLPLLLPVVVLAPGHYALPSGLPHSWPWVGTLPGEFTLVGIPILAGFSAVLLTVRSEDAVQLTAKTSLMTGVLLALDAVAVHEFGIVFGWIGILVMVLGRELPVWWLRHRENRNDPLFAPSMEGVRILATREGSLGEKMGLLPAELVTHVNQVPVHSNYDLHFAFDQNPAYAKLQVVDRQGEARIVGKPVYTGELNQLGLILAPDQPLAASYHKPQIGLLQTIYLRTEPPTKALPMAIEDSTSQT